MTFFTSQLTEPVQLVIAWLIAVNVLALLMFGLDKLFAIQGWRRIRERTLFFLVLIGGGVGALLGMHLFRHKTRKLSFQIVIALILLVQLGLLAFFVSGDWFSTA